MTVIIFFRRTTLLVLLLLSQACLIKAQTDVDYDMMAKNLFCTGVMYGYSSWDHYWEGTFKRSNQNFGTVSTQMLSWMGNYGVSKKVNLLFMLPYIKTQASGGTMRGMDGLQDLSLFVKWKPVNIQAGNGKVSLIGVGGVSFPVSNYVADFLPLAIGLRSKNIIIRAIADYQTGKFFVTGSGTYLYRSNITIDRAVYYTNTMQLNNEVRMPDAASFNFRTGYRGKHLIAEAVAANWTTLGGFDITKNNMPFPSNKMNMTTAGISFRYVPARLSHLTLTAEGNYTIAGRNAGQSTAVNGGAFYIINFNSKKNTH